MRTYFNKMIEMIEDEDKREFAFYITKFIPKYFWSVPASSSGKYHPITDLGEGGLVRHSLMVCKVALDLLESNELNVNRDDVIIATLFHDCCKQGFSDSGNEHTLFKHPLIARDLIKGLANIYYNTEIPYNITMICQAIASHMGKWNTSKYEKGCLPIPKSSFDMLIHEADYIASRKYVLFDKEYFESL